jgi:hypothetical protein
VPFAGIEKEAITTNTKDQRPSIQRVEFAFIFVSLKHEFRNQLGAVDRR